MLVVDPQLPERFELLPCTGDRALGGSVMIIEQVVQKSYAFIGWMTARRVCTGVQIRLIGERGQVEGPICNV